MCLFWQLSAAVVQALLQADLGATTSYQIIEDLRQTAKAEDRRLEPDDIKAVLRATLIQVCAVKRYLSVRLSDWAASSPLSNVQAKGLGSLFFIPLPPRFLISQLRFEDKNLGDGLL